MAVAGKYLWIALFVVLQITVGLCRSTESPLNADKGNTVKVNTDKISDGSTLSKAAQKADVVPNKMAYDPYDDRELMNKYYHRALNVSAIYGIVVCVFIFASLILGCVVYYCRQNEPRRGYVVNTNQGGQTNAIQQPMGVTQPMPHPPPAYGQGQNMYPQVQATKY